MTGGEIMEKGNLTMSVKEINRIAIMEKLVSGDIKVKQAASSLQLSTRQVKRLKKSFTLLGVKGLIHKSRGKASSRKVPGKEIARALRIVGKKYPDFGPTFALEKLKELHGITFSRETLRGAMIGNGMWKPKKQRYVVVHQQRKRRIREGELVQVDGSPHLWFENRGPYCTLLVFIDDATGKLKHLMFARAETTNDYFRATDAYIRQFGKPVALYTDKHGVFRVNTKRNNMASVDDANGLTQFGRAMQELAITLIFANSPEAKGRVEKANGTLQDRLVKEMRLKGISNLKDGNLYLPEFMEAYNQRFSVCALSK
jgi:transposase